MDFDLSAIRVCTAPSIYFRCPGTTSASTGRLLIWVVLRAVDPSTPCPQLIRGMGPHHDQIHIQGLSMAVDLFRATTADGVDIRYNSGLLILVAQFLLVKLLDPFLHLSHHFFSLHVAPVSGMIAPDRCGWAPLWSERHSRRYDLSEQPVQACLDKRGPG